MQPSSHLELNRTGYTGRLFGSRPTQQTSPTLQPTRDPAWFPVAVDPGWKCSLCFNLFFVKWPPSKPPSKHSCTTPSSPLSLVGPVQAEGSTIWGMLVVGYSRSRVSPHWKRRSNRGPVQVWWQYCGQGQHRIDYSCDHATPLSGTSQWV